MQTKYESEKKDKEISLLNADKEISNAKISRQRVLNYGLIAVAFLIVMSAYLVYRNIQHKRKAEAQYAALEKQHAIETMRSKISIDIHDDLGSGLTKIGLLTQQIQNKKDSPKAFDELMNKIQSSSKEVVTGLREVIWASNPANDNLASLLFFMRNYIHRFFEGTSFKYTIDFPGDIPEMNIHPEVKRNLFLTLKESLNNMVKHSGASEVNMRFLNDKEKFSFEITDNGNGFDSLPNGEGRGGAGNGLRNMKKRMEDIQATFDLISSSGQGVKIVMEGKLY
jgi:signal transduction histidine kinase